MTHATPEGWNQIDSPYTPSEDITLYVKDGIWVAHTNGADGDEVESLFGTRVLPTPYTVQTPAGTVVAEIERRNPGKVVRAI